MGKAEYVLSTGFRGYESIEELNSVAIKNHYDTFECEDVSINIDNYTDSVRINGRELCVSYIV